MKRRSFALGILSLFGLKSAAAQDQGFPPVPKWRPSFSQPLDQILERMTYYTDARVDFVVFANGTCVLLEPNLTEPEAKAFARKTLSDIINYHPDMNPMMMDDGNVLVRYNHPAFNIVLQDVAKAHWDDIEKHHEDGLVASEVLMTPLGPNRFDDVGKQALLGRAYMFMDAQSQVIALLKRKA